MILPPARRDTLKAFGIFVGGTCFPWSAHAGNERGERIILPDQATGFTPPRAITAITLGATPWRQGR